jgi:hypothetical protein
MNTQPPLNLNSGADPYAQIRSLQFTKFEDTVTEGDSGVSVIPGGWAPTNAQGLVDWKGLLGEFESKYNNFTQNPDGTISGVLQQPGAHKYDTMTGTWRQGADGQWELANDPMQSLSRQRSSADSYKDAIEQAAALAAIMGTAYIGGTALAGASGGTAGTAAATTGTTAGTTAGGNVLTGANALTGGGGLSATTSMPTMAGLNAGGFVAPSLGSGAATSTAATAATGASMGGLGSALAYGIGSGLVGALFAPDEPDMSGVNDSARSNAAVAKETLEFAKTQYADQLKLFEQYRPMFDEQIQLSLDSQRKNNARSDAQWADYENIWRPTEKRLAEMSLDMASPGRIAQEAQRSADETAGQYDEAIKANRDALIASGASPEKVAAMESSMRLQAARGTGGAFGQGRRDAETKAISLIDNSARFGRNMPSTGLATATVSGQQGGQAVGSYGALSGAMAAPGQIMLPQVQTAINANNASGSLFANMANTQLNSSIARNNQIMGGIGAGLKLYGLNLGGP